MYKILSCPIPDYLNESRFNSLYRLYLQMVFVSKSRFALPGFLRDLRISPAFNIGALYAKLIFGTFGNRSHDLKGVSDMSEPNNFL